MFGEPADCEFAVKDDFQGILLGNFSREDNVSVVLVFFVNQLFWLTNQNQGLIKGHIFDEGFDHLVHATLTTNLANVAIGALCEIRIRF